MSQNRQGCEGEAKARILLKNHGFFLFVAREQFRKDTGIRSILLIIDKDGKRVYWNFIDVLEKGENFTTKNQIRIYPITNFLSEEKLEDLHNGN